jgi:hypothetical protein
MPTNRTRNTVRLEIEVPADLHRELAAAAAGEPLKTWVLRHLARKVGRRYTPPARGRPRKDAAG